MADASAETAPTVSAQVDATRPNSARVYDWYLGGSGNFAVDREFGQRIADEFPMIKEAAISNRRWLGRLVRAAARAGIRQFLDLGSGVPTVGNVHEIAAQELDSARVVYVDNEHVAATHARMTLEDQGAQHWCGIVQQDYRHPDAILHHPETQRLLDFTQPICVIFASVLHFIGPGDDPAGLLDRYRSALSPGSWLAVSHPGVDDADEEVAARGRAVFSAYAEAGTPAWLRDYDEVAAWFDGLTWVAPGLVHPPDWRPELDADPTLPHDEQAVRGTYWCGVGAIPPSA